MTKPAPLYEGRLDVHVISSDSLAQYMKFRGYSVRSLAEAVGVSKSTIGWLTSGRRSYCKPEVAKQIAKRLDCPVQALFAATVDHGSRTIHRAA